MIRAVLLDVDGTLVDSNDAHAHAWVDAFATEGLNVDFETVRRFIGMGGDKLMPAVSGVEESSPTGERISKRRGDVFRERYLPTLKPFRDAGALVAALNDAGYRMVAASSAKRDELEPLLKIAGADALLHGATSSDDAAESKPEPDIVKVALKKAKAKPGEAILLGDTPYDIEAAARAGVATIAFRCGGWGDADLEGAVLIYDGPWDLLAHLAASPLGVRGRTS